MRILITGGAGFIGRHFCRAWATEGHEIVSLDLFAPDVTLPYSRVVIGDVRDPAAVETALTGCEFVLHLAAAHHDFGITTATSFSVNRDGTRVLCEAMARSGVHRLCFFSSVAVYGNALSPVTEASPNNPTGAYGESKLAAELVVRAWAAENMQRQVLIIRPTVVFGRFHFANMYSLIRQATGAFFVMVGTGDNRKSLIHVDNLIAAVKHLLAVSDQRVAVYNAVDHPDLSSREIIEVIRQVAGRSRVPWSLSPTLVELLAIPFELWGRLAGRHVAISRGRIRKLFSSETRFDAGQLRATGFSAPRTLVDGLADMTSWYLQEGRRLKPAIHLPPADVANSRSP